MKKIFLTSLLTFLLASCSIHQKRDIASEENSNIAVMLRSNTVIGRQQHIILKILPPLGITLKTKAYLVFANESIYEVQLVSNPSDESDESYDLDVHVPFTFNIRQTKIQIADEQNDKIYKIPLSD